MLGCQGLKGPCGDAAGTFACCLAPAALAELVTALQQHHAQQTGGERAWPRYKPTIATSLTWESSQERVTEVFTCLYLGTQADASSFMFSGLVSLCASPSSGEQVTTSSLCCRLSEMSTGSSALPFQEIPATAVSQQTLSCSEFPTCCSWGGIQWLEKKEVEL